MPAELEKSICFVVLVTRERLLLQTPFSEFFKRDVPILTQPVLLISQDDNATLSYYYLIFHLIFTLYQLCHHFRYDSTFFLKDLRDEKGQLQRGAKLMMDEMVTFILPQIRLV